MRYDKNLSDSAPVERAFRGKCLSFGKWGNNTTIARPVYYVPLAKSHRASHWLSLTTAKSIARSRQVSREQSISYPGHGIIRNNREAGRKRGRWRRRPSESRIARPFMRIHSFSRAAHMCVRACKFPSFLAKTSPSSQKRENVVVQKLLCRVSPAYTISPSPPLPSIVSPCFFLSIILLRWLTLFSGPRISMGFMAEM